MKFAVMILALLGLLLVAAGPASGQGGPVADGEVRAQLAEFLKNHQLRLATTGETAGKDFSFNVVLLPPQSVRDQVQPRAICVESKDERIGMIILVGDAPWQLGNKDVMLSAEPRRTGGIVLHEPQSLHYVLTAGDSGMLMSGGWDLENQTGESRIEVDLGKLLASAVVNARSIEFKQTPNPMYVIRTDRTTMEVHLSRPESRFALSRVSIEQGGATMVIGDFRVGRPPVHSAVGLTMEAIAAADVNVRKSEHGEILPGFPPGAYPTEADRPAVRTLRRLIPESAEGLAVSNARQILELTDALQLMLDEGDATETFKSAMQLLQTKLRHIGVQVAARERAGMGLPYYDWSYDRNRSYDVLVKLLTESGAADVIKLLARISSSSELSLRERFIALDLLGDTGVAAGSDLIERISKSLRPHDDKSLLAVLASVRFRLQQATADDERMLKEQWQRKNETPIIRKRCIETLLLAGKLSDDEMHSLPALLDHLHKTAHNEPWELQRYHSIIGSSRQGRSILLSAIEKKPDSPWISGAMAVAIKSIEQDDAQWGAMLNLCRRIAAKPGEDEQIISAAVHFLKFRANDTRAVTGFVQAAAESGSAALGNIAFSLVGSDRRILDYANDLTPFIESPDAAIRKQLILAIRRDDRALNTSKQAANLVNRGLNDKDAGVRAAAMLVIMDQLTQRRMQTNDLQDFLQKIVQLAAVARQPRELANSLFIIELISDGKFKINGAPRTNGYLDVGTAADKWWQQNGDTPRRKALDWAVENGYKVVY